MASSSVGGINELSGLHVVLYLPMPAIKPLKLTDVPPRPRSHRRPSGSRGQPPRPGPVSPSAWTPLTRTPSRRPWPSWATPPRAWPRGTALRRPLPLRLPLPPLPPPPSPRCFAPPPALRHPTTSSPRSSSRRRRTLCPWRLTTSLPRLPRPLPPPPPDPSPPLLPLPLPLALDPSTLPLPAPPPQSRPRR